MIGVGGGQRNMPRTRKFQKGKLYWLPPHTVMIVDHYCKNYDVYKAEYKAIQLDIGVSGVSYDGMPGGNGTGSATESQAIRLAEISKHMKTIEDAVKAACAKYPTLEPYMLQAVTMEKASYELMSEVHRIPCGRNLYLSLRHHIFWLIAKQLKI